MTRVAELGKSRFAQKLLEFSSKMRKSGRLSSGRIQNENCFVHMKMAHDMVLCHIILRVTSWVKAKRVSTAFFRANSRLDKAWSGL
jgi:hypothetical protein